MNQEEFETIFKAQVELCEEMLLVKGREYANEDRLHNFRVAANLQNLTLEQTLGGFLAKHIVSIYDLIWDKTQPDYDVWDEKILDSLNYLFLLKAVVEEYKSAL